MFKAGLPVTTYNCFKLVTNKNRKKKCNEFQFKHQSVLLFHAMFYKNALQHVIFEINLMNRLQNHI